MTEGALLGPFRLVSVLGRGGMGTVWAAEVVDGDARVAVKTLTASVAREPAYIRDLHTEVRAMAAMTHPNIALVLDHGMAAEAPWLAMELASGGSLASARPTTWLELRTALVAVLSGLAHAHARGVVHRDIKPANVLRCTAADLRPGWKLADFGIARASGAAADRRIRGTPRYMAPEQFLGHWRDQGPWTDLYAVGCLAWELVTGRTPFWGDARAQQSAHLQREPPPLVPVLSVPRAFEGWARGLLEKGTTARTQRAAAAIRDLLALGEPDLRPHELAAAPLEATETWSTNTLDPLSAEWLPSAIAPVAPAPLPAGWRPAREPEPTIHLRGVGLGLFMLRAGRVSGRLAERDALWAALRRVVEEGRGRALVLRGATGVGKSRLAEWLARRAHEVGCTHLPLVHRGSPELDADGGLVRMVREAFGAEELDAGSLGRRLRRLLGPREDAARLEAGVRALSPGGAGTDDEQRAALAWLICAHARVRPVILHLGDAQWSLAALRLIEALLDRQTSDPAPVLAVVTVRTEALGARPRARRLLELLGERSAVESLEVDPMPAGDLVALVRDLLGLDGQLAHRVALRAAGNPLFATQLVGAWARRGVLTRGPGGFGLPDRAELELPSDLGDVWLARLQGVQRDWPEAWSAGAELAATLGSEIAVDEWIAAAGEAELRGARPALDELLSEGLLCAVDPLGERIRFAHAMVREALVAQAARSGRAAGLHGAIAQVLERSAERGAVERLGRHLLQSGRAEAALEPLWEGSERRRRRGQFGIADALLRDRERALRAAGIPERDPRWSVTWRTRAEYARMYGDTEASLLLAQRAAAAADHPGLRGAARRVAGIALYRLGRREEALVELEAAMALARAASDRPLEARCHTSLSYLLPVMGRREEAERHAREALALLQGLGSDPTPLGNAWSSLGSALVASDRLDEAERAMEEAVRAYEAAGNRAGIAMIANDRGDVLRLTGRLAEAEASYARSVSAYAAVGAMQQHIAELNLGIVHLAQGRLARARPHLQRCAREFHAHGWGYVEAAAEVGLAACALAAGQGEPWDAHIARASELWRDGGVDADFARVCVLAARVAEAHDPARAPAAWALAAAQWEACGFAEEAAAARARAALS